MSEEEIESLSGINCCMYHKETAEQAIKYIKELQQELQLKDKKIEKLKLHNKELLRKLKNRVKEVKKLNKYSQYKNEFKALNKELQLKDKVIYSMAEYISSLDIEEDICNKTGKDLCECDSMNFGECEHCIMEYFINKVKGE